MRLNFVDLWHEEYETLPLCEKVYGVVTALVLLPVIIGLQIGYKLMKVRRVK